MSHLRTLQQCGLGVGVLVLLLAVSEIVTYGGPCLPPSPNPCAADGVCRPNRMTWGYSRTRWRQWPGEPISQLPTPAEDAAGEGDLQALPPFETPKPEQEDLRGPAKDKADKTNDDEAVEISDEGPAVLLPGPEALPAFDPQGNNQLDPNTPTQEDAPPALPASLRHAALLMKTPQLTNQQQPIAVRAPVLPAAVPRATVSSPIHQASWQQSPSIQLINPASAIVIEPEAGALQQAIYYEASDLGDELAE